MASILIVHQNFPGQFPHVAAALAARGDKVAAIGEKARAMPGVDVRRWKNDRSSTPGLFPAATRAEADLIRAEAAAAAAAALKRDGFTPQVVIGHPGWGETLHLKEIWPAARLILFGEYYYRTQGGDVDFDPEFPPLDLAAKLRINAKNATQAFAYTMADRIVAPTAFQAGTFPPALRARIRVLHEGLDLARARRNPAARVTLADGAVLDAATPAVTFVNRTLEPLRGFHVFMRALPAFLDAVPDGRALIVGADRASGYGTPSPQGKGWKAALLAELGDRIDLSRVHFTGQVPHATLIDILSISAAHVYYTYPFVLSWSLVEAMACECLILASDTGPVRDAITDGQDGLLLPFFDVDALSAAMIRAAREPQAFAALRRHARATALAGFTRERGVAGWLALVDELLA